MLPVAIIEPGIVIAHIETLSNTHNRKFNPYSNIPNHKTFARKISLPQYNFDNGKRPRSEVWE
jgi:hypothetical protein